MYLWARDEEAVSAPARRSWLGWSVLVALKGVISSFLHGPTASLT